MKHSTYDLASSIVWRAGHDNPENVSDAERFKICMQHIMAFDKNGVKVRENPSQVRKGYWDPVKKVGVPE